MPTPPAIIWLEEAESTNDVVRKALPGLDNLSVVAARRQTCGRGQGDHKWSSVPGRSLTFTFVLKNGMKAADAQYVTKITTHAICAYLAGHGISTRVKLPNDIYVGDLKICGILIENIILGKSLEASIVGVGLNVGDESFPEWIPNPVSMKMLTGRDYDLEEELERLHTYIVRSASLLDSQDGRTGLDDWFSANSFRRDV